MVQATQLNLEKDSSFLKETWAWYAIGCIVIITRFLVRMRTVGIRHFQGDDYIAVISLVMYTADAVLVDFVYYAGSNVDVPLSLVNNLSKEDEASVRWGSKCQLAAWYTYTALIWCMKFMLLFFYKRLTMGTFQAKFIRYLFWICGVTYLAVFFTITFGCYPTERNWQVRPLPPRACTFKPQNFYVGAVLNVFTDALILMVPIPMLWRLQVRLSKKLAIGALLSSGLFVITAAIVRAVLTLGATPSGLNINRWGVRETLVGILTVNLPILRPMFTRGFWTSSPYKGSGVEETSASWSRRPAKSGYGRGTIELSSRSDTRKAGDEEEVFGSNTSQENIFRKESDEEFGPAGVVVETSYSVQSHRREDADDLGNWAKDGSRKGFHTNISAQNGP